MPRKIVLIILMLLFTFEVTAQSIRIQASFDMESRTYMYRDELKMTVMADRNCYFKIVYISADNRMKMIYPNSHDRNNYLRANMSRAIFETANCIVYKPYGVATILVIASTEQFSNIEQEYNAPWIAATNLEDSARQSAGEGEARYSITILRPDEEYEYPRPSNMTEAVRSLREDVVRQGGYFAAGSNDASGYYILNNVRGSYRVLRGTHDTLQFAIYFLDSYIVGLNPDLQPRTRESRESREESILSDPNATVPNSSGSGFNFSFERPGDIAQAIYAVRSGIEAKGGTFTGNEQQGTFRASGITGHYRISDVVNVTITEKPLLFPNSLIEREIRNYFRGR